MSRDPNFDTPLRSHTQKYENTIFALRDAKNLNRVSAKSDSQKWRNQVLKTTISNSKTCKNPFWSFIQNFHFPKKGGFLKVFFEINLMHIKFLSKRGRWIHEGMKQEAVKENLMTNCSSGRTCDNDEIQRWGAERDLNEARGYDIHSGAMVAMAVMRRRQLRLSRMSA